STWTSQRLCCSLALRARDETLLSLVHRLVTATYFEDAATAVLQAMFACAEEVLGRGASHHEREGIQGRTLSKYPCRVETASRRCSASGVRSINTRPC
ncbi:MAG TPA: hypothetical protein VLM79_26005, partial [Kofleriaceae bacterium]|nr:hypothetical protein [Kofleriaceae bacterium]